jgi:hypothetical protein
MTRAPDTQPPDGTHCVLYRMCRLIRAEYLCRACSAIAGQAELKIYTDYDEATLIVSGIVNRVTTWVGTDHIPHVADFLTRGDAAALFKWEHDSASFYCPTCNSVYCQSHWRIETKFDDEPELPGWYDCTYGTCPQGHRRMIDD